MANIITELHLEMSDNWYVTKKLNSVGRVGENTVTKLVIEPTEILDNVTYELEIMSADGSKNVAELTVDGTELYLILTANMLSVSGITKMQVRAVFEDGSIKKSNIFELKVNRSISATDYYEEYAVTIFDQLVQDCRDIIEGAESYAVRAETAAVNAEAYEQSASASAEAASASASTASTASTVAVNAAASAESASTSAHTSAENATTAAASASTAATSASTSATNAANSATAAATSATNAANSAVNASTSETNASASAAEAEASAESIAASAAQINENTYRINDLEAIIGGYQLTDLPTGTVANITDGTALLMPSLKVGIEPVQDLHGYDHPWAGGAGKNKIPPRNDNTIQSVGLTITIKDGIITLNGTASGSTGLRCSESEFQLPAGTYTASYGADAYIHIRNITDSTDINTSTFTLDSAKTLQMYYDVHANDTFNNVAVKPQIEQGSTATSYEPYSNICPISGWTAANIIVSPTTSAEDGTTYNIQFRDGDNPLTVYGGTLDVVNGVLTVTDAHIASYNAETLPSTWISDRDVYAEGATPTTGAEVVYKLAEPITYQLTPTQIRTLVGTNNIWADTGDIISGKYYRSPF